MLPSKLKIGDHDVDVVVMDSLDGLSRRRRGEYSSIKSEIRVLQGMKADQQRETLMHETLHGLFWFMNIQNDKEEELISALSGGICMVLRDNPEFARLFINDALSTPSI